MPIPDIRRSVAHARLARAIQTGQPAEVVDRLRDEYHATAARDKIAELVPRVAPEFRGELAALLLGQGGDDVAA